MKLLWAHGPIYGGGYFKSAETVWRDTLLEYARAGGKMFKEIGAEHGISGARVSQCLQKRERLRRVSRSRLAAFKAEQCHIEMLQIKRAYDNMGADEKAANKERMAAEIDKLLAHYRDVAA